MSAPQRSSLARSLGLIACLFALMPSITLAQDASVEISEQHFADSLKRAQVVGDEISKHQEQYSRLHDEYITSARRMNTVELVEARSREISMLMEVGNHLEGIDAAFTALRIHMLLAGLVTRKQLLPAANRLVKTHRDYMIKRTHNSIRHIEEILHLVRDKETSRLLLEARDFFRSSAELLDRLQVPTQ